MQKEIDSCHIKNNLRRRLAGNLAGKSADSSSVEYSRTLPRLRLDLPTTLHHDASAGRVHSFFEPSRRLAGNLAPVLRSHRGEGGCTTIHPPVATDHFERIATGGAAHGARAFCLRKTKSDKIAFSKSYFLPLKKIEKTNFFLILWDICGKYYPFIPKGNLRKIGINAILYNMFAFPAGFSPANISTGSKFEGFYL